MAIGRRVSALGGLAAAAYAVAVRPRVLRWGATDEEVRQPYPGAALIPGGKRGATMAVTIQAPPSQVWPWLVQMGCDRAGWYSWDRLDNGGFPSAERIHPEWQQISVGDHLASRPDGTAWFEIAALEPERFLALRAPLDLRGRPFDTAGPRPRHFSDSVWSFLLEKLPDENTRLVVSGYATGRPRLLLTVGNLILWEPAHLVMQTRQFANLKRRAEGNSSTKGESHAEADDRPRRGLDRDSRSRPGRAASLRARARGARYAGERALPRPLE